MYRVYLVEKAGEEEQNTQRVGKFVYTVTESKVVISIRKRVS